MNMLAVQRSGHPVAAEDSAKAVTEAWQRGLLRPGVADVTYLDWLTQPFNIAALAVALGELARDGLLCVVWPALDSVVAASLRAPRLVAGTAEIVDTIASLLPEVLSAVADGRAEPNALDLPATRELASGSGTARAVVAAREIVAQLPAPTTPAHSVLADGPTVLNREFDEVWPADAGTLEAIPDGVDIVASWVKSGGRPDELRFDLTLPGPSGRRFRRQTTWTYDLEREGQCQVRELLDTDEPSNSTVWLHWDVARSALVVEPLRERRQGGTRLLRGEAVSPLSNALVTIVVGHLGYGGGSGGYLIQQLLERRRIGSAAVTAATKMLLRSPAISPAKLVSTLEKRVNLLPVLWPLLTESISAAAHKPGTPPTWLNRVLSVALMHSQHLAEAARRAYLPASAATWPGLANLAARPGTAASITKAKALQSALNP